METESENIRRRKSHGGARDGAGRKPINDSEETVVMGIRMTIGQREKLDRLGGSSWVRRQIDSATDPERG
jgi:hypothetical protein